MTDRVYQAAYWRQIPADLTFVEAQKAIQLIECSADTLTRENRDRIYALGQIQIAGARPSDV